MYAPNHSGNVMHKNVALIYYMLYTTLAECIPRLDNQKVANAMRYVGTWGSFNGKGNGGELGWW